MESGSGYPGNLDDGLCGPGVGKRAFRGSGGLPEPGFVAFLGGTETMGLGVSAPFPDLVGRSLGVPVLNLGCESGGFGTVGGSPSPLALCRSAVACVIQDTGSATLTNPYYAVQRVRPDRLASTSLRLQGLYPELDFSGFHFVRHLLAALAAVDADRFALVCRGLRETWTQRLILLAGAVPAPCLLLELHGAEASEATDRAGAARLAAIGPRLAGVVRVALPHPCWQDDGHGMVFAPLKRPAARALPTPRGHRRIAAEVVAALREILVREDVSTPDVQRPAGVAGLQRVSVRCRADQSFSISSGTALKRSATRP